MPFCSGLTGFRF